MRCFFTIWNLKSAIRYKYGRAVLSRIFIFFSCTMHYTFQRLLFTMYFPYFPLFLIDRNQKQVLLIKESSFSASSKIFFSSFHFLKNDHIHNFASTLIKIIKLDIESNNIVSTLSNVVNINVEIDNLDLMLFNGVNFNIDIYKVVWTLIWHCPTSQWHITRTATLRQHWKVFWLLTNVTKRLHNFVNFIKLKTYIFSKIFLNCCFRKLSKRYWWNNFSLKKTNK